MSHNRRAAKPLRMNNFDGQLDQQKCVIVTVADMGFLPAACCALISSRNFTPPNMNVSRLLLAVDVPEQQIAEANGFLRTHGIEPCVRHVEVDRLLSDKIHVDERVTKSSYVRLLLDELVADDADRVLYLDADTRIVSSLEPLFQTDFEGFPVAAVHDVYYYVQDRLAERNKRLGSPTTTNYCNAGVLLLNWPEVLRHGLLEKARTFAASFPERCKAHDQDALNAVIAGRYLPLDPRWNQTHLYYVSGGSASPWIKHFTGGKPWTRRRIVAWHNDALWYQQLLDGSPWCGFFEEQSWVDRLKMWLLDYRKLARNYKRVASASMVPFLTPPEVRERARQFMKSDPGEVASIVDRWIRESSKTVTSTDSETD